MRFMEQSQLPNTTPGTEASGSATGSGTDWRGSEGSCGRLEPAGADTGRQPHLWSMPHPPEHSPEVNPLFIDLLIHVSL